jgi:hypothetical protein
MDRFWYHRLLDGAVAAGVEAETELKSLGYKVDLGTKISIASPFKMWFFGSRNVRSKNKMDLFYGILLASLILVSAALEFGVHPKYSSALPALPALPAPSPAALPKAMTPPAQAAKPPALAKVQH